MFATNIPWGKLQLYFWALRRQFATIDVPGGYPHVVVDVEPDEMNEVFRRGHFMVTWEWSYRYEGEVLNVVRPEYEDDEYEWYQLHVRGFMWKGKLVLLAHFELDPTEYPRDHIDEVNLDIDKGTELLKEFLEENGIEYTVRDNIKL